MRKTLLVASMTALLATGCANTTTNQQRGAAIGGVIGAIAGKGTGDHDKSRYAWGAAIGAIAGAAIGTYMDKQERELREQLADSGVEVHREGDTIRLHIPGNITFKTDEADIVSNFHPVLNDVALVLGEYDKTRLSIEGHTDSVGDAEYNQRLSIRRANSVADYLAAQGVATARLQTVGMGETAPVASNEMSSGRQQNRRVELRIIPQQA